MKIELINGKWLVNGNQFSQMTINERKILDQFIQNTRYGSK